MRRGCTRLRTVLVWEDVIQFEMGCQVLEEAGIPFDRDGRTINSVEDPACFFGVNCLSLQVREQDHARAFELLSSTVGRGVIGGA